MIKSESVVALQPASGSLPQSRHESRDCWGSAAVVLQRMHSRLPAGVQQSSCCSRPAAAHPNPNASLAPGVSGGVRWSVKRSQRGRAGAALAAGVGQLVWTHPRHCFGWQNQSGGPRLSSLSGPSQTTRGDRVACAPSANTVCVEWPRLAACRLSTSVQLGVSSVSQSHHHKDEA